MSEPGVRRGATRALYGLVVASVLLPLLAFVGGGFLAWRAVVAEAQQDLGRSLEVATEQATEVLDTQLLVADRVNDLVGDMPDNRIAGDEAALRDRLAEMVRRFPQVTGILVIGADGHALVSTLRFPIDRAIAFNDREYFLTLQDPTRPFQIGAVADGRLTNQPAFTVARRKGNDPRHFAGAIVVSVSPHYFETFDRTLLNDSPDYVVGLFREDGVNLAHYPAIRNGAPVWGGYNPLLEAIRRQPLGGLIRVPAGADSTDRLIAYRRLDTYPVYASIARRWGSLWAAWRVLMATHLVYGVPATAALVLLALDAARRARHQEATLAALEAEVQRRELAEDALRQAQKMEAVGRLTGGIAHDFNNHLTVISSNIELLKRRLTPDNPTLIRLADAAMQGVQRAATLTHRLLAFSRQQPLDPEPLDAGRLVTGMSDLLQRTLGEGVTVETVLAAGLWQTRVDANQLENALLNLAVNARDAMPTGGKLTIETANIHLDDAYADAHVEVEAGHYVTVAISDTGGGMTPEVIARAFDPFFTTKPLGQGTGLGLSMVYGFVKQSGGHVKIYSELGRGSTVKLYLPRYVRQEERQPAAARMPRRAAHETGETILVVEDDAAVRRASVEALREMGYVVLEAPDAMEAFRLILDRGGIDLLFTDVGLPGGVNGRALADAARNAAIGLKVLFTTGYTRNAILHNGTLDGGVHFLAKPFSLEQLASKIREALDTSTAEDAKPIGSAGKG
ncbi:MAG: ATP-binding protein [Acetobacteraceae bacterium]|nr:ATP-binding protein [Acetobacteraceae bacterium]